jgi:hypothetical protein
MAGSAVAGDAHQHAEFQQQAADAHQRPSLACALQSEDVSADGEIGVRGGFQQTFAQGPKGDLGFGAFEHRAGKTEKHIAILVELRQPARGVVDCGSPLVEAGTLALHLQIPSGFPPEPVT